MMLESLAKARAGEFADAELLVTAMKRRGSLTVDQMTSWADAVDEVQKTMPAAAKPQLTALRAALFRC